MKHTLFKSKRILITAGPTREAIDPVRFISNHSTGKMGYAIAEYLHSIGADAHVVSGPVSIDTTLPPSAITAIATADEMLAVTRQLAVDADIVIFAAAVGDYKSASIAKQKIKKNGEALYVKLIPNPDIAFELSKAKTANQLFVGFALETENGIENAVAKMFRKKFDCIVLNLQHAHGSGFGYDTNKIQIIDSDLTHSDFELKLKSSVAIDIVNHIKARMSENKQTVCHV